MDTCFIASALIPAEAHHAACQAFLVRLAEADTTVYYNRLLDLELAETAFKIAKERHGKNARSASGRTAGSGAALAA